MRVTTDSIKFDTSKNDLKKVEKDIKERETKAQQKLYAEALVDNLAGQSMAESYKGYKALKKDVEEDLKAQYKDNKITKEQYEEAKKYLKGDDFEDTRKAQYEAEATGVVAGLAAKYDNQNNEKKIEKLVLNELEQQKKDGLINEEQYNVYKNAAKRRGKFAKFWGKDDKNSNHVYRREARRNNVDMTKAKAKENGIQFNDDDLAKIKAAGYSVEDLYNIFDANGGASDGTINYSYTKKQTGERNLLLAALNNENIKKVNGVEFDVDDIKSIGRALGYTVEKKVDAGKVFVDAGKGLLIGSPAVVGVKNTATASAGAGAEAIAKNTVVLPIGAVVGTGIGAGASVLNQIHRVEERAIPTDVPEGINTYDDYAYYLDEHATKKGAAIGKAIAKHYINKEDGTLLVEQMNKDLSTAAGTDDATATPVNYEEACGLLADLESGKKTVKQPEKKEDKKQEELNVSVTKIETSTIVKEKDPTSCYEVKAGDDWYRVVTAKYNVEGKAAKAIVRQLKDQYYNEHKAELNAKGITSSYGAFFPKAGETLCVPSTVKFGDQEYNYKEDAKVTPGAVNNDPNYNGIATSGAELATYSDKTKYNESYDVYQDKQRIASGLTKEEIQPTIDKVVEGNPDKKVNVSNPFAQ